MRVLRIYHAGRDPGHRARERALVAAGVDLTLVVPRGWPDSGSQRDLPRENFRIVELPVSRGGDANRHVYTDTAALTGVLSDVRPNLIDLHEEPFSLATRQWLRVVDGLPVVMYTAQNLDKRFPPPFAQYERAALRRVNALYPCTRQAASVARGKGFTGIIGVLPLGFEESLFTPGEQSLDDPVILLGLVGRLVPEKGVRDAVRVLASVRRVRPARLRVVGSGSELKPALELAASLGVADAVDVSSWRPVADMAELYRQMHVVLVPSTSTPTWIEQFGRVIVEGRASGAVVAGYASGSIPEVAGSPGLLVSEGDTAGLAAAVAGLVADPASYAQRRASGLAANQGLSWGEVGRAQAALYEQVLSDGSPRMELPDTAAGRRAAARAEFGPVARTRVGERPFALPYLREGGSASRILAQAIDRGVSARERHLPHRAS